MTATEAAMKMQQERGYVVIGFPESVEGHDGEIVTSFAGQTLLGHNLVVRTETNYADWQAQVAAIFGAKHPANKKHPKKAGQTFFRCDLVSEKSA